MIRLYIHLIKLLNKSQKIKLFFIQLGLILMSVLEVLSIYSIAPFIGFASGKLNPENSIIIEYITRLTGLENWNMIFIYLGFFVLSTYIFSIIVTIFITSKYTRFANDIGAQLASLMFKNYLSKPYAFFLNNNTGNLVSTILNDSSRVTAIISRGLNINSHLTKTLFIVLSLLVFDYKIAIAIFLILLLVYLTVFISLKNKLSLDGKNLSLSESFLTQIMNEGISSFRDVLINKKQKIFYNLFKNYREIISNCRTRIDIYSILPRYFIEGVGFSIVISLVLYFSKENFNSTIIILSIFGAALIKLIPCFQHLYFNISAVKSYVFSFDRIKNDLVSTELKLKKNNKSAKKIIYKPKSFLEFKNVNFSYPSSKFPVLKNINCKIKLNGSIGLIGKTGTGKSTFLNLCMSLLKPTLGKIYFDGNELNKNLTSEWHNIISYVPQTPFLLDATLKQNICYDYQEFDDDRLKRALSFSKLTKLVNNLPEGMNTKIGEKGVRLSGGQIQRITIARALYKNSKIIFLDEATNALDDITEKEIFKTINSFENITKFIVSHKLDNLINCDQLILLKNSTFKLIKIDQKDKRKKNKIIKDAFKSL